MACFVVGAAGAAIAGSVVSAGLNYALSSSGGNSADPQIAAADASAQLLQQRYNDTKDSLLGVDRDTENLQNKYIRNGDLASNKVSRFLATDQYNGLTAKGIENDWRTNKDLQDQLAKAGAIENVAIDPRTGKRLVQVNGQWGSMVNGKFQGFGAKTMRGKVQVIQNKDGTTTRWGVNPDGTAWTRRIGADGKPIDPNRVNSMGYRKTGKYGDVVSKLEADGRYAFTSGPNRGSLINKPTLADYQQSPGYQFQLQQGLKAMGSQAASRGLALSGGSLKAAGQFATGLAAQDYNNWYNNELQRRQQVYGFLSGQQQLGQQGGAQKAGTKVGLYSTLGQFGANAADQQAAAITNGGLAQSQAIQNDRAANQGLANSIAGLVGTGVSAFNSY